MPLLVVGADHSLGEAIVRYTLAPDREVRAFVTDPSKGTELKNLGAKVAVGDLSDEGHVAAAATRCFVIVFVLDALEDGRDLAFAASSAVPETWARAAQEAEVTRVIWVGSGEVPSSVPEIATVSTENRSAEEIAIEVASLDDRATL